MTSAAGLNRVMANCSSIVTMASFTVWIRRRLRSSVSRSARAICSRQPSVSTSAVAATSTSNTTTAAPVATVRMVAGQVCKATSSSMPTTTMKG